MGPRDPTFPPRRGGVGSIVARWSSYGYLCARLFVDLYEAGQVRDELWQLVNRETIPDDPHPGDYNMQDVPGTAHGAWFHPGSPVSPEDPHLALVESHILPTRHAFSVGTSVPTVGSGVFMFVPLDDDVRDRKFSDVTPDDTVYGYITQGPVVTFFITMPDADTLWIETLDGEHPDPADWVFTDDKVVFRR